MHLPHSPQVARIPARQHSESAFSLVEIALAIAIIAFAFVALFGLLPTGLTTFRSAIDTTNTTRIVQEINSLVQATEFEKLNDWAFKDNNVISNYDEEGNLIARTGPTTLGMVAALTAKQKLQMIYQVKIFYTPITMGDAATVQKDIDGDPANSSKPISVTVVVCNRSSGAGTTFDNVKTSADVSKLGPQPGLTRRTFFLSKMSGVTPPK